MSRAGITQLGGVYVSIGADLAGLVQGEAQAKAIAQRIESQRIALKPTIDFAQINQQLSQYVANAARAVVTLTARLDAAQLQQQLTAIVPQGFTVPVTLNTVRLQQQLASLAAQTLTVPVNFTAAGANLFAGLQTTMQANTLAVEALTAAVQNMNPGGRGGGGGGQQGQSRGQGRQFNWRNQNALSTRGLGRVLGNVTALYAVETLSRLGSGLVNASNTENHPEWIAQQFDKPGHVFSRDANVLNLSKQIAQTTATQERWQAVDSLPIVGGLLSLGYNMSGDKAAGERANEYRKKQIESYETAIELQARQPQIEAQMRGNSLLATTEKNTQELAPLRIAASKAEDLATQFYDTHHTTYFNRRTSRTETEMSPEDHKTWTQLQQTAATEKGIADHQQKIDETQENAIRASLPLEIRAATSSLAASRLEGSFTPGSILQAQTEKQQAALARFDAETKTKFPNLDPNSAEGRVRAANRQNIVQEGQNTREAAEREETRHIERTRAEGQAAILNADQQHYAARMVMLQDANAAELEAVRGHGAGVIQAVKDKQAQVMEAARAEEVQQVANSVQTSIAGIASSRFTGAKMQFEAQQATRLNQQSIELERTENPIQRLFLQAEFEAQNKAAYETDRRQQAIESMRLAARAEVARDTIEDKPLQARAAQAIARAREELMNAGPEHFVETQNAIGAELEAQQHEMLGERGGKVGIASHAGNVAGDPLDLSGTARDRKAANAALDAARAKTAAAKAPAMPLALPPWLGKMAGNLFGQIGVPHIHAGGKDNAPPQWDSVVKCLQTMSDKIDKMAAVAG